MNCKANLKFYYVKTPNKTRYTSHNIMSSELAKVMDEKVYGDLLIKIKQQIRSVQAKAALVVNTSLIQLYWDLGEMIADNQALFEGRNNYVAQLEKDLKAEFLDMKGFEDSTNFIQTVQSNKLLD